jgi:hypothetical protein
VVESLINNGKISPEMDFFKAWTTCAINLNTDCKVHTDDDDYVSGLCWVITLGEFTGGHLRLDDVNVEFRMGNGSVAAFKSSSLNHSVTKHQGQRYSIVLFIDDIIMGDGMTLMNK